AFVLGLQLKPLNCFSTLLNVQIGDPLLPPNLLPPLLQNSLSIAISEQKGFVSPNSIPLARQAGPATLELKLFGFIPLPKLVLNVVPPVYVVPGGHSIGVMVNHQGIIVVGIAPIFDDAGRKESPAHQAGINTGDVILQINEQKLRSSRQMQQIIDRAGQQRLMFTVLHQGKVKKIAVQPVYCQQSKRYRIGLYVRDGASGVGTLSFYHPVSGIYGALGHIIADQDTGIKIKPSKGAIFEARVVNIHMGRSGQPGEKVGRFIAQGAITGSITSNTSLGIFGHLDKPVFNPYFASPIPVAMSYQVQKGPAELYTVLSGQQIHRFAVEVVDVLPPFMQRQGKGMIIRVTDPELLATTGGIIQGMSGSPIVQQGRLIGVVTHVFLNKPEQGYAAMAEWMVEEAGLWEREKNKKTTAADRAA
ncbi:MAG: SpoIVB peptidase, partial [Bacillota bacterium]